MAGRAAVAPAARVVPAGWPLQFEAPGINDSLSREQLGRTSFTMSPIHTERPPRAPGDEVRAMLSLRETALLAETPEAAVRKDIETGVLPAIKAGSSARLLFRWADVYVLAAVYKGSLLPSALRKKAFEEFESLVEPSCRRLFYAHMDAETLMAATCGRSRLARLFASCERLRLGGHLFIDMVEVAQDVSPRVDLYAEGLSRIEEREGVLGGEAVFRNTRLSVGHIGKMRNGGESIESIREDYPYLHERDIAFAQLYDRSHPSVGRPSTREEALLAGHTPAR
jgi:uncharacterized protein (DUF433 family)